MDTRKTMTISGFAATSTALFFKAMKEVMVKTEDQILSDNLIYDGDKVSFSKSGIGKYQISFAITLMLTIGLLTDAVTKNKTKTLTNVGMALMMTIFLFKALQEETLDITADIVNKRVGRDVLDIGFSMANHVWQMLLVITAGLSAGAMHHYFSQPSRSQQSTNSQKRIDEIDDEISDALKKRK